MAHYVLINPTVIEDFLAKYPVRFDAEGGLPCVIRPMDKNDEGAFRDFHSAIPERDQLFIKNRIKDGSLFHEWLVMGAKGDHFGLLAFIDGRLAAWGSLHLRPGGWKRHIGRVYFLTNPNHRGMGLIDRMVKEIIDISLHCGLTKLETELNGEREVAIKALAGAGFSELVRIPDYIQDMSGKPHDYVLMGMELIPDFENLGTGD